MKAKLYLITLVFLLISPIIYSQCTDPNLLQPGCDFDGDGIINSVDLDDDNDGILDTNEGCLESNSLDWNIPAPLAATPGNPASTVMNIPIASGGNITTTINLEADINHVTIQGNGQSIFQERDPQGGGGSAIDFFPHGINSTTQDNMAILDFSQPIYNLTFAVTDVDGGNGTSDETFEIIGSLNGNIVVLSPANITIITGPAPIQTGNYFEGEASNNNLFIVTYDQPIDRLEFIAGITSDDVNYANVISVFDFYFDTAIDYDQDGMPDCLDNDSDNDGCPDAVEAGHIDANGDGVLDGTGIDNTNGRVTGYATGYTGTTTAVTDINDNSACCDATKSGWTDSDGDLVADNCDLDDDNDGILNTDEGYSCSSINGEFGGTFGTLAAGVGTRNLLNPGPANAASYTSNATNGFGAGTYAVTSQAAYPVTSWHSLFYNKLGHTTGTPEDAFLIVNGNTTQGTFFSETVNITNGGAYELSVWACNLYGSGAPAEVDVQLFDATGTTLLHQASTGLLPLSGVWTHGSLIFNVPPGTYVFKLINISTASSGNDFAIDDFSLAALDSSLCNSPDTDGDGIPNHLDLDSDGDGCTDAVEAGHTDLDGDGILDGTGIDITNGQVTGFATGYTGITAAVTDINNDSACCDSSKSGWPDTDGDLVADDCDLDDDNDGILDLVECPIVDSGLTGPLTFSFDLDTSNNPNDNSTPHLLLSITPPTGIMYEDFIIPSGYTSDFNNINSNAGIRKALNGVYQSSYANFANSTLWDAYILPTFQNHNLNDYQALDSNNFTTSSYTLNYTTPVRSTAGAYISITERGGNNPVKITALDQSNNPIGTPITVNSGQYTTLQVNALPGGNQSMFMAVYPVDDLAPIGTEIFGLKVEFPSATSDGPDSKVFFFGDIELSTCDHDNDGITNDLDLDSDGDGCPDISEAGVLAYISDNNLGNIVTSGSVTNGNGVDATANTTSTIDEAMMNIDNGGDTVGPDNGFHDALESTTAGEYNNAPYDLTLYFDPLQGNCVCYKPGTGTSVLSKVGISTLNRHVNQNTSHWPEDEKSAYLVLDSHEKGFVITRLSETEILALNAVEGMLVYDSTNDCLKLYNGTEWFCLVQTCND